MERVGETQNIIPPKYHHLEFCQMKLLNPINLVSIKSCINTGAFVLYYKTIFRFGLSGFGLLFMSSRT